MGKLYHILTDKSMSDKIVVLIIYFMSEKFNPVIFEGEKEKEYPFVVNEQGELRVPGFGDINEPYNADAHEVDDKGISRIDRFLDVIKDENGKYIKARYKNEEEFKNKMREQLNKGAQITNEVHKRVVRRLTGMREEAPKVKDAKSFEKVLSGYFDSDPWFRGMILGWDVKTMKSKTTEPSYKLSVIFEDNLYKQGKRKVYFIGAYKEILDKLEKKINEYEAPLRLVGEEEEAV